MVAVGPMRTAQTGARRALFGREPAPAEAQAADGPARAAASIVTAAATNTAVVRPSDASATSVFDATMVPASDASDSADADGLAVPQDLLDPRFADKRYVPIYAEAPANGPGPVVHLARRSLHGSGRPTCVPVWSHERSDPKAARAVYAWMMSHADEWTFWGRVAVGLGADALTPVIVDGAAAAAVKAAEESSRRRKDAKEKAEKAQEVSLYLFDAKNRRPGLGLERGDEEKPFIDMRFTAKADRDRVYDWIRWQRHRFLEWHDFCAEHGALELERLIIAGMRETEADVRTRGLASRGGRPLRLWRGE